MTPLARITEILRLMEDEDRSFYVDEVIDALDLFAEHVADKVMARQAAGARDDG